MISIITNYLNNCMICGNSTIEHHHALYGNKHKLADQDKLIMPLCPRHHNSSNMSVHMNKEMKILSQQIAQLSWERKYLAEKLSNINKEELEKKSVEEWFSEAREAFRTRYGESYL